VNMVVHIKLSALRESQWHEYLVRFVLGGLATVFAGVVADIYGPEAGGLFLAFPAIFCASATLIEKHERQRKEEKGMQGARRGKEAAALDAAGAGWGSVGLALFGAAVFMLAETWGPSSLLIAALVWFSVAVLLWQLRRKVRVSQVGRHH
jgi:Protein of unknown function (DUF3147)